MGVRHFKVVNRNQPYIRIKAGENKRYIQRSKDVGFQRNLIYLLTHLLSPFSVRFLTSLRDLCCPFKSNSNLQNGGLPK